MPASTADQHETEKKRLTNVSDIISVPKNENYRKARLKQWADRRKKFEDAYGSQSVGAYQSIANPTQSFRDWTVNSHGSITSYTDYLQPEFLLHRYGGTFVLRESDLLNGGKSLAQDCRVPKRDANGVWIPDEDNGPVDMKEAA